MRQNQNVGQGSTKPAPPSPPDDEMQGSAAQADDRMTSDVDTGAGLAGSDVLDAGMNRHGSSTTGDPSEVVEVTPQDLVNRNAPDATVLNPERPGNAGVKVAEKDGVEVRRIEHRGDDSSSGESGAPDGTDATGIGGASGGTAGTAGSAGSGVGAGP